MFFDAHGDILTDVAEQLKEGVDIWEEYHMPKYKQSKLMGSIFVNFTDPKSKSQREEFEMINDMALDYFKKRDDINIIYNKDDFNEKKFNLVFGIEGLNALKNVEELEDIYKLGYRHIGITWNEKNKFATGAMEEGGLTSLGESLVNKALELGMILDYAHLNKQSFCDVANISNKPIFVSHANPRGVCDHPRNLDDEQLELVKKSGGVIGLAAMSFFLNEDKENASIADLIKHIKYIRDNFGIDYVGFGFDFCYYLGDRNSYNKVKGLEHITAVLDIPILLEKEGFTKEEIEKVCYKNMLRVIKAHLND